MSRPVHRTRLFALRARLARRLTWAAVAGLCAVAVLFLALLAGMGLALAHSWEAIHAGQPLSTGVSSLLAAICGLAAVAVGDILFSAPPPPPGIRLPRAAADDFYRVLDELAARLDIEPIRHVFITEEMNAQILQRPAWGVCGPLRTFLLLGLPLAHSLTPAQLHAVLAHELAHVAAQRSGWDAVGAHARAWWARTLERAAMSSTRIEAWVDQRSDRFCRWMLRLVRVEELEADALAAQLVGKEVMGEALIEVSLKARFLERDYWPRMHARSLASWTAIRPYREMGLGVEAGFVRQPTAPEFGGGVDGERDAEFGASERVRADPSFHPSLRERLRALRTPLRMPVPDTPSAARRYFEPLLPTLAWVFDCAWSADAEAGADSVGSD